MHKDKSLQKIQDDAMARPIVRESQYRVPRRLEISKPTERANQRRSNSCVPVASPALETKSRKAQRYEKSATSVLQVFLLSFIPASLPLYPSILLLAVSSCRRGFERTLVYGESTRDSAQLLTVAPSRGTVRCKPIQIRRYNPRFR